MALKSLVIRTLLSMSAVFSVVMSSPISADESTLENPATPQRYESWCRETKRLLLANIPSLNRRELVSDPTVQAILLRQAEEVIALHRDVAPTDDDKRVVRKLRMLSQPNHDRNDPPSEMDAVSAEQAATHATFGALEIILIFPPKGLSNLRRHFDHVSSDRTGRPVYERE